MAYLKFTYTTLTIICKEGVTWQRLTVQSVHHTTALRSGVTITVEKKSRIPRAATPTMVEAMVEAANKSAIIAKAMIPIISMDIVITTIVVPLLLAIVAALAGSEKKEWVVSTTHSNFLGDVINDKC